MAISYITESPEKINGGTIVNIGKDTQNNQNFVSSGIDKNFIGSIVTDSNDTDRADPSKEFAHNNSRPIFNLYTKTSARLSDSNNSKIIRSSNLGSSIRSGDYNILTNKFKDGTSQQNITNYLSLNFNQRKQILQNKINDLNQIDFDTDIDIDNLALKTKNLSESQLDQIIYNSVLNTILNNKYTVGIDEINKSLSDILDQATRSKNSINFPSQINLKFAPKPKFPFDSGKIVTCTGLSEDNRLCAGGVKIAAWNLQYSIPTQADMSMPACFGTSGQWYGCTNNGFSTFENESDVDIVVFTKSAEIIYDIYDMDKPPVIMCRENLLLIPTCSVLCVSLSSDVKPAISKLCYRWTPAKYADNTPGWPGPGPNDNTPGWPGPGEGEVDVNREGRVVILDPTYYETTCSRDPCGQLVGIAFSRWDISLLPNDSFKTFLGEVLSKDYEFVWDGPDVPGGPIYKTIVETQTVPGGDTYTTTINVSKNANTSYASIGIVGQNYINGTQVVFASDYITNSTNQSKPNEGFFGVGSTPAGWASNIAYDGTINKFTFTVG